MAINDVTTVVGVSPRISSAKFVDVLRASGSPAAIEGNAEDAWSVVEQVGVDPAFALAVFHQESQFGTDGDSATAQSNLRNPGHTRSSRTGVGERVDTIFGPFIRYPSWTEGWRDLAVRLVDPEFFYVRGLPDKPPGLGPHRSIRPILQIWAPEDDQFDTEGFNNHERYVRNVVSNMTNWIDLPDGGGLVTGGSPIVGVTGCPLTPPPPFDGTDKHVGEVVFHAAAQTVEVEQDGLRCRQFADPASCETRVALRRGDTFEALYWVEGVEVDGERRWWVARSGSRIWSGGTRQKPAEA
jgi:hypothetical protein